VEEVTKRGPSIANTCSGRNGVSRSVNRWSRGQPHGLGHDNSHNFIRIYQTLRVTPAMAGADRLRAIEDRVALLR
jgi:hypothetical protein